MFVLKYITINLCIVIIVFYCKTKNNKLWVSWFFFMLYVWRIMSILISIAFVFSKFEFLIKESLYFQNNIFVHCWHPQLPFKNDNISCSVIKTGPDRLVRLEKTGTGPLSGSILMMDRLSYWTVQIRFNQSVFIKNCWIKPTKTPVQNRFVSQISVSFLKSHSPSIVAFV